jgi:SAM-dependent methyltransferase
MDAKANPEYYNGYRTDLNPLLPVAARRVLEVGGGSGAFRHNLPEGVEYWLVEPVPGAAAKASGLVDRVLVGTYEQVSTEVPDKYFDLVICNDVIEHMPFWREFLVGIQDKMAPGAVLVGSIPNVRHFVNVYNFLFRRDWRYTETGILETTHFAFFTEKSLRRELVHAGFRIERFELMKKLTYTRQQRLLKYAASLVLVAMLGRDSRFGQFGFRCTPDTSGGGRAPKACVSGGQA